MKDIFDIPQSLREAIAKVASIDHEPMVVQSSWRRDLDVRPIILHGGLFNRTLTEVYFGHVKDYYIADAVAAKAHSDLQFPKNIPAEAIASLHHYSRDGFDRINTLMRDAYVNQRSIPDDVQNHIDNIKSILHPRTSVNNLKLYTGVKESPAKTAGFEWNSTRPIKLITFPTFTSTTTSYDMASDFSKVDTETVHHESDHHGIIHSNAKHIIELTFPTEIHHAASMINHSNSPHEEEILLGPIHTFELNPRPTLVRSHAWNEYVWKATYHSSGNPMFKQRDFTKR